MTVRRTLFLADDDQDDRFFLREAIGTVDAEIVIVEAIDGIELLKLIENISAAELTLIVLDMNMPRMNGLETIKAIRTNPKFSRIPAVMISTSSDPWLIEQVKIAGFQHFISKPSSLDGFTALAKQLCTSF